VAKRIRAGKYEYKGFIISCHGYYGPDKRVVWEAVNPKTNCGEYHGYSKKEIINLIDGDTN